MVVAADAAVVLVIVVVVVVVVIEVVPVVVVPACSSSTKSSHNLGVSARSHHPSLSNPILAVTPKLKRSSARNPARCRKMPMPDCPASCTCSAQGGA